MTRSPRPRGTARLSESIHQRLNMYALVASASGVGLLALTPLAEAKIIYTPAHAKVIRFVPLPIDLNHDGIVDFYLASGANSNVNFLNVCQYATQTFRGTGCAYNGLGTNAMRTIDSKGAEYAAALRNGAKVQDGRFAKSRANLGYVFFPSKGPSWRGPWFNGGKGVTNRYLGLKFQIKGRFHFGWARVTVTVSDGITTTLTGYAYETIPGKGIVAGQTKGRAVTTPNPASLGHLAAGASAIPAWRSGR